MVAPLLAPLLIAAADGFAGWQPLNDTIMGGRSRGTVQATSEGLVMEAFVEPEGGGFVSCRSPVFDPPLDLSSYGALELQLDGDGRSRQLAAQFTQHLVEVGADAIHLIDEYQSRHFVAIGLTPYCFSLWLYAGTGTQYNNSGIKYAQ